MKKVSDEQIKDLIYDPATIGRIGTENIKYRRENSWDAMQFGVPEVDEIYNPLLRGELECIIGRPGSGKTGLMMYRARSRAAWLAENQPTVNGKPSGVAYLTYEQHAEDLHLFMVAASEGISTTSMARGEISDEEYAKVVQAGTRRSQLPLWFLGHSKARAGKTPPVTISVLERIVVEMSKTMSLDTLFIDYLQLMPPDKYHETKVVTTTEMLRETKQLAGRLNVRISQAVQAKREVDSYAVPVPMLDDGQWTSAIEQFADKVFSVTRPAKYCRTDGTETFGKENPVIVCGHRQMLVYLLKQKMGDDNKMAWVDFDPVFNTLAERQRNDGEYAGKVDRTHIDPPRKLGF